MCIYKTILDTLVCIAALATGVSAVVAVIHYLRQWRDDEVRLAVEAQDEATETRNGRAEWHAAVTITNVGKVPVTITGLELAEDPQQKRMQLVTTFGIDGLLDQGAAVKCGTFVSAREQGVALPERMTIRCKYTKTKTPNGYVIIEPHKRGPAGQ